MKKAIIVIFLLFVIAIGGILYYAYTHIDYFIKIAIEQYGSEVTQTPVTVDNVQLDLQQGSCAIYGIRIGNLAGYTDPDIFSLNEISVKFNREQTHEKLVVIDRFTVDQAKVFFEINSDNKANLYELRDRIKAKIETAASLDDSVSTSEKNEPKLIVHHIEIAEGGIQAKVASLGNKLYQIKLPPLVMENLGGESGVAPSEIVQQILAKLTDQAKIAIKQQGLDKEYAEITSRLNLNLETEKEKLANKASKQLEAQKQKATDKLESLLNK